MKILFTDASFDHHHTEKTKETYVRGKIAVNGEGITAIDRVAVGKVPGLKQYINVLELTAIARAVELACRFKEEDNMLSIYSDSQVAVIWASSGKIKEKVLTEAHESALEYLRQARIKFGGVVTFHHVKRDKNPAGHMLAEELKKESPHAI